MSTTPETTTGVEEQDLDTELVLTAEDFENLLTPEDDEEISDLRRRLRSSEAVNIVIG